MFNLLPIITKAYAATFNTDIGDVTDLGGYVSEILSGGVYLGYLIGGLVFAYAGLKMIVSSGSPESVGGAKSLMAGVVTGVIILYLISIIINLIGIQAPKPTINLPSLLITSLITSAHAETIKTEFGDVAVPEGSYLELESLFNKGILPNAFKIAGVLAVIAVIATGLLLASSWGNPEKMVTAKKNFVWAILGMAIIIFSYVIVEEVGKQIRTGEPDGTSAGGSPGDEPTVGPSSPDEPSEESGGTVPESGAEEAPPLGL